MELIKLECPNCGGKLSIETGIDTYYCDHCGYKILIDDDARRIAKLKEKEIEENNNRDIKIKEEELKHESDLYEKKLAYEERKEVRESKESKIFFIGFIVFFFAMMLILLGINYMEEQDKVGKIEVPSSAYEYSKVNYMVAATEFNELGFTNIQLTPLNDLNSTLIDKLLSKDGKIDRISIGGDTEFSEGAYFNPDDLVVITYHSLPGKETERFIGTQDATEEKTDEHIETTTKRVEKTTSASKETTKNTMSTTKKRVSQINTGYEDIINKTKSISGIIDYFVLTETDENAEYSVPDDCLAQIYYMHSDLKEYFNVIDALEAGTSGGACLEFYKSNSDAKKRDEYLKTFDGTWIDSGSHVVCDNVIIRTSDLFDKEKQNKLTAEFKKALNY